MQHNTRLRNVGQIFCMNMVEAWFCFVYHSSWFKQNRVASKST